MKARWLICALSVLLYACTSRPSYQKPLVPVEVVAAEPYRGSDMVRYSASIEPNLQIDVAFKVGGYVAKIGNTSGRLLQAGDVVEQGTLLAQVRKSDYENRVQQAQGAVQEAEALLEQARADALRATRLYQSEVITKPDYEGATAKLQATEARLESLKGQLAEARTALADSSLIAPFRGVILKRIVEPGVLVAPGSTAFILAVVSQVKARFGVPDYIVNKAKLGRRVQLTAQSIPGRHFEGRISSIAVAADPKSRIFDVEVSIPNETGILRAGMVVTVELSAAALREVEDSKNPLVVPLTAIVRPPSDPQGYAVFVVEKSGDSHFARSRPIELGPVYGNRISVTKGVIPGELVIVRGATLITDGEAVRVVQ